MAEKPHARLAPSSASIWGHCALAPNMEEEHGYDDRTEANSEGDVFHDIMEKCLVKERDPYSFVGKTFTRGEFEIEIDEAAAEMIAEGIDRVEDIPGKLFVEKRVKLDRWMPGQFGTLDIGIIGRRRITIWDNKFGRVPVSPVMNFQLQLYALGFWDQIARHMTSVTDFRLIVWQPRVPNGGGIWDTTLEDLLEFGVQMKFAAEATEARNPKATPGPWCLYCPGAKARKCEAHDEHMLRTIIDDFDNLDHDVAHDLPPKPFHLMPPEQRRYLLENKPLIDRWFQRLEAEAMEDARMGRPTPGQKLVEGRRPPRKWRAQERAQKRLVRLLGEDDAFTRKLKSPAQVEKELPPRIWERLSDEIETGEPKPTLVPEHDSRPAITPLIDLFDDE
ncbi:DUF2800 domain-containing protein [Amorphus orientalis]|uniref:Uncharacterized protein n=1 Tax=Amorphus orientalis TaxID=649198 RepID=A0AAE3VU06_9HYPH|nr:DUF2800 domain-containing protein [Amorphus orientalis]MDQ0317778.1 hypothetical protein [Amorphus orientalis]